MIVKETSSGNRFLIPEGLHDARCVIVAGIGEQVSTWEGKEKRQEKVILTWEIPGIKFVFDEERGEEPAHISRPLTASLGERATLRKILQSWRGKAFTQEELEGFDLRNVLGAPCQVLIKQEHKGDNVYCNVADVLKANGEVPEASRELIHYDSHNHDQDSFDKLPAWIQGKVSAITPTEEMAPDVEEEEEDDNLPF